MNPDADKFNAMQAESGGVMSLEVVYPAEVEALLERGAPFGESLRMLTVVQMLMRSHREREGTEDALCCATCRDVLGPGKVGAFVIAAPFVDGPTHALAFMLCDVCGSGSKAEVEARGFAGLQLIWPETRYVGTVHGQAGHG